DAFGEYTLSDYRMSRLKNLKGKMQRQQSIGAGLLLNYAIQRLAPGMGIPPDIVTGKYGKPELRGGELFFSLSHSKNMAACAVSDGEIGIDIQITSDGSEKLIKRIFREDERKYIESHPDRQYAFTELWSLKESYIKARGMGLKIPLSGFSVFETAGMWHAAAGEFHIGVCSMKYPEVRPDEFKRIEL
ncbi:MAG: 4'-phosphopantetheinyl transferase family protein, partial [Candidatus Limivicinus sp.]